MGPFISFILSIVFTIIITWYFTKKQMKKNEITHFSINSYNVGKGLHNDFPKFQLSYENKELSNEVLVLKGGFINSGRNDISGLKNDSDINIVLPEECSIREIKIRSLSNDLDVTACKNKSASNIISFAIDEKFMSGECFEYTAIIETTKEIKNLHHKIKLKHRIPNTSEIKKEYIIDKQIQNAHPIDTGLFFMRMKENGIGIFSLIVAILLCIASVNLIFVQKVQYSIFEKTTNKETSIYMTPQSQLYVSDNDFIPFMDKQIISPKELDNNYYISPVTKYSWSSAYSIIGYVFVLMSIFYFIGAFISFRQWNKKKHIYHLLEQYKQEGL
ncbi:MAG: hypothetical protein J5709_01490 [Bacteroidales bacterium]|nr:hypothetical protein [Bacteroidales bacterium]